MYSLTDKVALVTGAGTGIGQATACLLASKGAKVYICGRREAPLQETCEMITSAGHQAQAITCDVSEEKAVTKMVAEILSDAGKIDILVNNAYTMSAAMLHEQNTQDWHNNFKVSLDGTFFCMREVLKGMYNLQSGAIVNVSSIMAIRVSLAMCGYSAAKAALIGLTQSAAMEAALHQVRINAVVPGIIQTPPTEPLMADPAARKGLENGVPLKRIGAAHEVAQAILFLCSDESSYITGVAMSVDGGQHCQLAATVEMDNFETG